MNLKPIFEIEQNPEVKNEYEYNWKLLKEKAYNISRSDIIRDITMTMGNGTKKYYGSIPKDLDVNELQLAMLCFGGYSWFGGSSSINYKEKKFVVEIFYD